MPPEQTGAILFGRIAFGAMTIGKDRLFSLVGIVLVCCAVSACDSGSVPPHNSDSNSIQTCDSAGDEPVRIPGGTFVMGQENVYPEEGPLRETTVSAFWMDSHEVTNRQFADFVRETGYVTIAERPVDPEQFDIPPEQIPAEMLEPGSAVFVPPDEPPRRAADWWRYIPGANWRRPYGPDGPAAVSAEPVVHLGWEDMQAYARWRGGRLPTEAEWEFAAASASSSSVAQPSPIQANTWQGPFPAHNEATDGFAGIAPVGCYPPNRYGLYDMIGNAWEAVSDFYRPGHDPSDTSDPAGPVLRETLNPTNPDTPSHVIKGGSFLCAPNYCQRYRPAARQGQDPILGASNVGFRLAYDEEP